MYCKIKQYRGIVLRGEFGYRTGQVGTRLACAQLGQKAKFRQKFELWNSWNWPVISTYLQLQQFNKFWSLNSSPETEIERKLAEICLEKLVKSHQRNLFCGGSSWTFFIGAPAQLRDRYSTAAHCRLTQVYSHTCTAVAVNVRFSQYRSRSAECAVALPPVDLTENISEFSYYCYGSKT